MLNVNTEAIQWWLGDLTEKFEENKDALTGLDLEAEHRLEHEIRGYLSEHPPGPGHGFDHHQRVRAFTTIIDIVNEADTETIKINRYAASTHDLLKEIGKGGKGPHNWEKLRELTRDLMEKAKIENRYLSRVIEVIEQHHEDDPSKRSVGNNLYEGDTNDITYLPRCFAVAQTLPQLYPTVDIVIADYTRYQINPSKPITEAGRRMFEKGKEWALPLLEDLKNKLGDSDAKPYFPFLGNQWRENKGIAPPVLKEALASYEETIPKFEKTIF